MPAFHPTADQFRAFRDFDHDGPIAQVNLLKFKDKATYQPNDPEYNEEVSGRTAYLRYANSFRGFGEELGLVEVYRGKAERFFIGEGDWDMVWINRFPNRKVFIATLNHPDYKPASRHRDAGLLHQELIVTHPEETGK